MAHEQQKPALYSVDEYYAIPPSGGEEKWHCWAVKEHTLVLGGPSTEIIAFCIFRETAERIRDALQQATPSTQVVVHIDGREVAKAVLPHLATSIRTGSGTRNI